jgi:hypothetical protein
MAKTRSPSRRTTSRSKAADWVHQFLIVLGNTEPLVWRRIQVPEKYSFWDLHVAIQDAMGWLDCHLHEFTVVVDSRRGEMRRFGIPGDEFVDQEPCQPDWTVKVSTYVPHGTLPILYVYDFGDDWHHVVLYEGAVATESRAAYPRCVSGARKCPPEDCACMATQNSSAPSGIPNIRSTSHCSSGPVGALIPTSSTRRRSCSTIRRSGGRPRSVTVAGEGRSIRSRRVPFRVPSRRQNPQHTAIQREWTPIAIAANWQKTERLGGWR